MEVLVISNVTFAAKSSNQRLVLKSTLKQFTWNIVTNVTFVPFQLHAKPTFQGMSMQSMEK